MSPLLMLSFALFEPRALYIGGTSEKISTRVRKLCTGYMIPLRKYLNGLEPHTTHQSLNKMILELVPGPSKRR